MLSRFFLYCTPSIIYYYYNKFRWGLFRVLTKVMFDASLGDISFVVPSDYDEMSIKDIDFAFEFLLENDNDDWHKLDEYKVYLLKKENGEEYCMTEDEIILYANKLHQEKDKLHKKQIYEAGEVFS